MLELNKNVNGMQTIYYITPCHHVPLQKLFQKPIYKLPAALSGKWTYHIRMLHFQNFMSITSTHPPSS